MKSNLQGFLFLDKRLPTTLRKRFYIDWYSWWRGVPHRAAVKAAHEYIARRRDDY